MIAIVIPSVARNLGSSDQCCGDRSLRPEVCALAAAQPPPAEPGSLNFGAPLRMTNSSLE